MSETREFPTPVVASLSSGVLLCDFSAMHECAEFLMGHPIWTHHFADRAIWQAMRDSVLAQCPGMPDEAAVEGVTHDNWNEYIAGLVARIGETQILQKGDGSTAKSPLEGIPEGKPTILIGID